MNDKLQQLYDLYKQKGIISTTDFNTFASASDDQRQKLYDLGVQKGLFNTTDYNTFNTAWGGSKQEPLKKKKSLPYWNPNRKNLLRLLLPKGGLKALLKSLFHKRNLELTTI